MDLGERHQHCVRLLEKRAHGVDRMADLQLTLACGPYDRTLGLQDGSIKPDGIELTYVARQPAEIFWRMLRYQEFDVSELSLSNCTSLVDAGSCPFIAIPVFPSKVF